MSNLQPFVQCNLKAQAENDLFSLFQVGNILTNLRSNGLGGDVLMQLGELQKHIRDEHIESNGKSCLEGHFEDDKGKGNNTNVPGIHNFVSLVRGNDCSNNYLAAQTPAMINSGPLRRIPDAAEEEVDKINGLLQDMIWMD